MKRAKRKSLKKADDAGPNAKRAKADPESHHDQTVFGKLVQEAGLRLREADEQDELEVDQSLFQTNLSSAFKRHLEYPQITDEFIEGLQERLEDPERFRLSLLPTVTSQDCRGSRGSTQDSVMRLLLGLVELQPKVANVLLEKLPEFDDESHMAAGNGDFDIPRLIVNQFRWLDCIVQGKELFQKMLEIVSISSVDIQRDIIICIPEVVDDSEHVLVAGELRKLLIQNTKLTVPILDALANLDLRPELLGDVRTSALRMLSRAEIDDLPVVIKFILQSVNDSDSFEVLNELRSNLDFASITSPMASSTPANRRQTNVGTSRATATKDSELLTLEAIASGLRFRKNVAEGWIKAIESVSSPAQHKVIDLFVLLILHSIDNRRKAAVSLLRSKIKAGHFTEEVLSQAFKSHAQIMREYFTGLLKLAGVLLRSLDPSVFAYGCAIYKFSFISFDLYSQQEVVGALVTHIGSGYVSEVEASLDVLSEIVEAHPDKMARFAIFVKDILYYLDNLKMGQIRKLFRMLSTLAFHASEEDGIQDDMYIVIRKQLSSNSAKYKRIGIIGAIMFVQSMARRRGEQTCEPSPSSEQSQQQSTLPDEVYKQVTNLLETVRSCVVHSPEAAALFYDELGRIIEQGQVDPKVQTWISETVVSDFQDDFLVDREADLPSNNFPMEFVFGLDEVEEGSIAVNMLPLLLAGNSGVKTQTESESDRPASLTCLAPHFRLLRICEEIQHKGDLEGVDALLGCPLISFKKEMSEKLDSLAQADREVICASLCYTINWFREVVNAFSSQGEPEMKGKTISRLESITVLQKMLERCLAATPSFVPPLANFDFEDSLTPSAVAVGTGAKVKKGKKAKKGTDEQDDSVEKIKDAENEDETGKDKPKEVEKTKAVSLSNYRACFRELDLRTFKMLKCGLVSRAVLDSNLNTKETTVIQLQAPQLQFLLEDLSKKLEYSLSASASSRRSFLKVKRDRNVGFSNLLRQSPKQVAIFMVNLLPVLCEHLEATSAFFQSLIAKNDGVVDGPGHESEEAQLMTSCYFLLFDCLQTFFSWSGFVRSENQALWKKALFALWSRMQLPSKSQPGDQEILKQAFHYLEQFSSTVPTMGAAVALTKLMVVINERHNSCTMNDALAELTANFLKRKWITAGGGRENGPKFNEALQYLLRIHLSLSADPLAAIEDIAAGAMTELLQEDSSASDSYPTLTRSSIASYYKAMLEELISHVKQSQSLPLKRTDTPEVKRDRLVKLHIAVRIFHILINLVKAFDQRQIIGAALKYARLFLEIFLKLGMPILDEMLRTHQDEVYGLIKNLQQSTRSLHHFCGHSKVEKNVTLTNHVPALKKCLETFVFRVKAMLALNKCHEAFWMGNLKNRDIQGQEIFSQQSVTDENADEEEEEEEEEMEVDDEDEDEEPEGSVASHDTGAEDCEED